MKLVLIGAPGSGKGTLAKKLAAKYELAHISTGDIIRSHIKKETPLGLQVKEILTRGELVSDVLVQELVEDYLSDDELINTYNGYILDGFPRTLTQAQWFVDKFQVDYYVIFDIDQETVLERISGRRVHPESGRTYHISFSPPKVEGKDDVTGEPLIQREDDESEKVITRMEVYQEQTFPIIDFIESKTTNAVRIDANGSEETMMKTTMRLIETT